jgi:hypothetical protein
MQYLGKRYYADNIFLTEWAEFLTNVAENSSCDLENMQKTIEELGYRLKLSLLD